MITVDSREGSKELVPVLSKMGVPVRMDYLAYGDVMFLGKGPEGGTLVGIEYKKLSDLLQSWNDGRLLGHQLPGMMNAYEVNYLLVEGVYSCNTEGQIQILRGTRWVPHESALKYSNLRGWLQTLSATYGVRVLECPNLLSSAVQVASLYGWYQKEWSDHGTAVTVHSPCLKTLLMPTPRQKVAAQFPGVGTDKLVSIEEVFGSVKEMVNADAAKWAEVKGVGKGTFNKIQEFLS